MIMFFKGGGNDYISMKHKIQLPNKGRPIFLFSGKKLLILEVGKTIS